MHAISEWNRFRNLSNFQDQFNRLFEHKRTESKPEQVKVNVTGSQN